MTQMTHAPAVSVDFSTDLIETKSNFEFTEQDVPGVMMNIMLSWFSLCDSCGTWLMHWCSLLTFQQEIEILIKGFNHKKWQILGLLDQMGPASIPISKNNFLNFVKYTQKVFHGSPNVSYPDTQRKGVE